MATQLVRVAGAKKGTLLYIEQHDAHKKLSSIPEKLLSAEVNHGRRANTRVSVPFNKRWMLP